MVRFGRANARKKTNQNERYVQRAERVGTEHFIFRSRIRLDSTVGIEGLARSCKSMIQGNRPGRI